MVRLLDRVDLCVSPGDCVFVYHSDPAGARVLLAALEGEPRLVETRWWHGVRHAAPGVRLRRASIRAALADDIREGWREVVGPSLHDVRSAGLTPTVHLLRASRSGTASSTERRAWRQWATAARQAGGAVVVLAAADGEPSMRRVASPAISGAMAAESSQASRIRESLPPSAMHDPEAGLRALRLHHGRVDTLHFSMPPVVYPES